MNGLIHPCCHPIDRPPPASEDEMMVLIFEYIERIFAIVRPRKLVYMAIDGVAPRAKMNQQRSRRFRAVREAAESATKLAELRAKLEADGVRLPQKKGHKFDSNCITPGTEFMEQLAVCLRYFIHRKLMEDPGWQNIKVILSDANVPGEGEHKIMDYIRHQRAHPEYDPNIKHVMYGADADLIMLGLATHEISFTIIREEFVPNTPKPCSICNQMGHESTECRGEASVPDSTVEAAPASGPKNFIFISIPILREYLSHELLISERLPFEFDIERAIDDWVFMCFFVGNDFLPHLPSLEIREGALETLLSIYRRRLPSMGGFITDSGQVVVERALEILREIGTMEDSIFQRRHSEDERQKRNEQRREQDRKRREQSERTWSPSMQLSQLGGPSSSSPAQRAPLFSHPPGSSSGPAHSSGSSALPKPPVQSDAEGHQAKKIKPDNSANRDAAKALKAALSGNATESVLDAAAAEAANAATSGDAPVETSSSMATDQEPPKGVKRAHSETDTTPSVSRDNSLASEFTFAPAPAEEAPAAAATATPALARASTSSRSNTPARGGDEDGEDGGDNDEVRLWEQGWKERYYQNKFHVSADDNDFRSKLAAAYLEGLCWVLQYYYQGVPSWKWYYPYHYAPFASDLPAATNVNTKFDKGPRPFRPLEQLMGVLPAASGNFVPKTWAKLMSDDESPILDFYPTEFEVDMNGKKAAWMGVVLLPFIEEKRLLDTLKTVYDDLRPEEVERNKLGYEVVYVGHKHAGFDSMCTIYSNSAPPLPTEIEPKLFQQMAGKLDHDDAVCLPGSTFISPLLEFGQESLDNNQAISAKYFMPEYPRDFIFKATIHPAATRPPPLLTPQDFEGKNKQMRGYSQHNNVINHDMNRPQMSLNPAWLPHSGGGGGGGDRGGFRRHDSDDRRNNGQQRFDPYYGNRNQGGQGYPREDRGGYEQRGGYEHRGGYRGGRGGFNGSRGGHDGSDNRGGYEGNRGGYEGNRGGYEGNRGGYEGNRGGYEGNRGGQYNHRGGYDNHRGGYGGGASNSPYASRPLPSHYVQPPQQQQPQHHHQQHQHQQGYNGGYGGASAPPAAAPQYGYDSRAHGGRPPQQGYYTGPAAQSYPPQQQQQPHHQNQGQQYGGPQQGGYQQPRPGTSPYARR
ncbi:5'-3' exoribonuclease 2 [Capsaspora owczarzaki ATCC 30864]|uniref:5'-3' exoribonuclease n=2 Tax=Capsaspora owczarzaki (strain ATCC 30864) TaxID=595528 RepID=A0A0D2VHN3_CAPO3|nr:5'-3' exoribonuclease 2 [Capsaspora owczarzaki ATCC 30864]